VIDSTPLEDKYRDLQQRLAAAEAKLLDPTLAHQNTLRQLDAAKDAIRFVIEKCVCENAGGQSDFAYLWTKDWHEFKRMAKEVVG
jgi:hypothetical protein